MIAFVHLAVEAICLGVLFGGAFGLAWYFTKWFLNDQPPGPPGWV